MQLRGIEIDDQFQMGARALVAMPAERHGRLLWRGTRDRECDPVDQVFAAEEARDGGVHLALQYVAEQGIQPLPVCYAKSFQVLAVLLEQLRLGSDFRCRQHRRRRPPVPVRAGN